MERYLPKTRVCVRSLYNDTVALKNLWSKVGCGHVDHVS